MLLTLCGNPLNVFVRDKSSDTGGKESGYCSGKSTSKMTQEAIQRDPQFRIHQFSDVVSGVLTHFQVLQMVCPLRDASAIILLR
jgi:hypothetical protein